MTEFFQWLVVVLAENSKNLAVATSITGIAWWAEHCRPAVTDSGLINRWHNLKNFTALLLGLIAVVPVLNWVAQLLPSVSLIDRLLPYWGSEGVTHAVLATFIYAAIWDFFQYWTHRVQHTFPALWVFHRVHHSDPAMNASTSLRQSLGGVLLSFFCTHIPTALICGGNLLPYAGSIVLFSGWGYINHANCRIELGVLTRFFSGPQLHRLHHGLEPHYHNSNYAAFFPVIDIVFGTFRMSKRGEWPATGLNDDTTPTNPVTQVFLPWRNVPISRQAPSMLAKVDVKQPEVVA